MPNFSVTINLTKANRTPQECLSTAIRTPTGPATITRWGYPDREAKDSEGPLGSVPGRYTTHADKAMPVTSTFKLN